MREIHIRKKTEQSYFTKMKGDRKWEPVTCQIGRWEMMKWSGEKAMFHFISDCRFSWYRILNCRLICFSVYKGAWVQLLFGKLDKFNHPWSFFSFFFQKRFLLCFSSNQYKFKNIILQFVIFVINNTFSTTTHNK